MHGRWDLSYDDNLDKWRGMDELGFLLYIFHFSTAYIMKLFSFLGLFLVQNTKSHSSRNWLRL